MTAPKCLYLIAISLGVVAGATRACADDDVTVISTPPASTTPPPKTVTADGTPVIHKSLHKKRPTTTSVAAQTSAPATLVSYPLPAQNKPVATTAVPTPHPQPVAPAKPLPTGPTVETGLPVARYPGMGSPIVGVSTYSPINAGVFPPAKPQVGSASHLPLFASTYASSYLPMTSSAAGSYSTPSPTTSAPSDFVFTNFSRRPKVTYPWKTNIITTEFWIGEGSTPLSSTTNVQSSWDEDWLSNNHGSDNPNYRSGYAAGGHASTLNPFYVALPFNDLAFPDKAREWLPPGWYRRPKDGKQVSACKDRWVEIKNQRGDYCYAQWEDVGPLRYDHAEYVFGDERPTGMGDDHAGLDVSPAVAEYLGIDGKNRLTSWRFVDDEDVRPGAWLKLDEQAVIFTALEQLKNSHATPTDLPIQRATEPIDDPSNVDANKKKVDASKG
jgi:hypothetical protein